MDPRITEGTQEKPALAGLRVCCSLINSYPLQNARTIKVAQALSGAGAEVTVLFSAPGDPPLPSGPLRAVRVPWSFAKISSRTNRLTRALENRVILPLRERLYEWLRTYGFDMNLYAAMRRERADVYHAYVLNSAMPAYLAARRQRAKVIYDVRDIFTDSRRASLSRAQFRSFERADRFVSRRADLVLGVSQPMADMMASRYGARHTGVLFNGPWECTDTPAPVHRPVRLFFQGFFEDDRNLEALIGAMPALSGEATLTLQGWGGCIEQLTSLVARLDLEDVVFFVDACGPDEVVACARDYDVGIVCHKGTTLNHTVTVPNKVMDYIGAGLAVAGSDLPGIGGIIDRYGCGMRIDPTDAGTLTRDLARLVGAPDDVFRMKGASVRACRELCWARQTEHLVDMYRQLIGRLA